MHEQLSVSLPPGPAYEQHYSVQQAAQMWGLGVEDRFAGAPAQTPLHHLAYSRKRPPARSPQTVRNKGEAGLDSRCFSMLVVLQDKGDS